MEAPVSSNIDNRLSRRRPHTHPAGEEMSIPELRNHLVKYHGWSIGQILQRGDVDGGGYMKQFHENEHATSHLDPRGYSATAEDS
jgi:hypothetical protein